MGLQQVEIYILILSVRGPSSYISIWLQILANKEGLRAERDKDKTCIYQ